jgi:hypothetical protein
MVKARGGKKAEGDDFFPKSANFHQSCIEAPHPGKIRDMFQK